MAMGGDYYALGQYLHRWGSWGNYTTSTIPDANFPVAKGYQMATNAVGNNSSLEGQSLAFTGEIATTTTNYKHPKPKRRKWRLWKTLEFGSKPIPIIL